MGTLDYKLSELVGIVKSLIPGRSNQTNVSRDFWMPDQCCRVCYECDAQFTVFIRRHHCRICGRVFCAKCTLNSVPAPFDVRYNSYEDCGRIRVCVYCFEQQEQGLVVAGASGQGLSPSASVTSLASTQSSWASNGGNSIVGSTLCPTEPYHHDLYNFSPSSPPSVMVDPVEDGEDKISPKSVNPITDTGVTSPDQFSFCKCRSGCEDDAHAVYCPDPEMQCSFHTKDYYVSANLNEADQISEPRRLHSDEENIVTENMYSSLLPDNLEKQSLKERNETEKEADGHDQSDEAEAPIYDVKYPRAASVDFENSGFLWLPPEPENEEDERETELFDDDDDDAEGSTGEWGHIHSSSFGSGEHRSRDNLMEEHRKAMNNVVEGHFRALVAQLLQVENLPVSDDDGKESWLDVITSLSWEAATLLKPDTSTVGGMDPSGYVKVKCIACGHPCESVVVKGVVCKKNVAHRRMTSKIDKPRLLILGGALEYQRVSSQLSSFDTLLQQEMDHLKMAVAKIDAHHPNVLLVEKSVSRFAQEYLLAKDISLVLNVKRPLLERIARCTGAQIVLSIDHLTSQKLGYCETFHVDKFLEEHGSAGQGGKKLTKTLMFFEGCPKPLGCTILLKGASGDELKKLKHVVQYGVFAAHHLALETSFLADEGASPSELPSKSPITVSLPNKPSIVGRSISPVPGFNIPDADKPQHPPYVSEQIGPHDSLNSDLALLADVAPICKSVVAQSACLSEGPSCQVTHAECASSPTEFGDSSHSLSYVGKDITSSYHNKASLIQMLENTKANSEDFLHEKFTSQTEEEDALVSNGFSGSQAEDSASTTGHQYTSDLTTLKQDNDNNHQKMGSLKEEFPDFSLSPSDNHNILVALSRRCVWKGTVCERSHFFRIKYYGISDKPLGRFLHDQLFDQSRRCRSCEMPPEAHIQCYTNRQGSLTISVKKLPDFTLPGEQEGKIWMWHRCLRCPRSNGFPPATRRIVMSDAAWGLSFGKFLELSFSNHAAASRVASCGHSLHRDCLRFYGFGRMVACFRYASIDLHSVYLPPSKLDFTYENQEWIQKEADEVRNRAEVLFKELYEDLHQILEKITGASSVDGAIGRSDHIHHISELELLLHIEKQDFEELLWKALNKEAKSDQPAVDILEINKLRRQLLFHSYMWEQRLMHAVGLKSSQEGLTSSMPKPQSQENPLSAAAKQYTSSDSYLVGPKLVKDGYEDKEGSYLSLPDGVHTGLDQDLNHKEGQTCPYTDTSNHSDILGARKDMQRVPSEGEVSIISDLSDTLDAAWTGENQTGSTKENIHKGSNLALADSHSSASVQSVAANPDVHKSIDEGSGTEIAHSFGSSLPPRKSDSVENFKSWVDTSLSFNRSLNKNPSWKYQKFGIAGEYNPVHAPSYWELEHRDGARLLLPVGVNDTVIPVYDDEPSSIISYALVSSDYNVQISEPERSKDSLDSSVSLPLLDSVNFLSLSSFVESISESYRSIGSSDESVSGSRSSQNLGPLLYTMDLHVRVSFTDDGPQGKVRYTVTCYYAKRFDALRKTCCSSELDFVRSLSRCKKWGAQGGKSNVFFAKTMDDRYIIKQVTKTELESFIKFAPSYFKYLSEFISTGSPTCLAKILGIYQVTTKHLKGGKESRMDVLVMENLLFKRNVTRLYDLKGSSRSRYNSDSSGNNKVLLDQNLIEAMPTSPIFLGTKAKRQLERAVWNDTSFLASIYVMDYSLLVGVDEEKHELVLGIIDFMRQYTWDKHLETWVKASGILGGPKNSEPTVISPKQYKKRFRKAMSAYFVMVPDQWSLLPFIPSGSQPDLCQDNAQAGASSLH